MRKHPLTDGVFQLAVEEGEKEGRKECGCKCACVGFEAVTDESSLESVVKIKTMNKMKRRQRMK